MIAALRAWGALRVVLAVGLTVVWIETMAADQLDVAPFTHSLDGWTFVPPFVAIALAEPLVDHSPQLTEHAARPTWVLAGARLLLAYAGALSVAGYCLLSPDGSGVAQWILVFVSISVVAVSVLAGWYWVPLILLFFGWLQLAPSEFPMTESSVLPAWVPAASVVVSCACYVAATEIRSAVERRR
jgi:hypothetical protein